MYKCFSYFEKYYAHTSLIPSSLVSYLLYREFDFADALSVISLTKSFSASHSSFISLFTSSCIFSS